MSLDFYCTSLRLRLRGYIHLNFLQLSLINKQNKALNFFRQAVQQHTPQSVFSSSSGCAPPLLHSFFYTHVFFSHHQVVRPRRFKTFFFVHGRGGGKGLRLIKSTSATTCCSRFYSRTWLRLRALRLRTLGRTAGSQSGR